ncbi:MAG TPA: polysaccharide biosynthesis protein [Lysobacter sp.]|jgi:Mrp family chromosome partitioning ATPase
MNSPRTLSHRNDEHDRPAPDHTVSPVVERHTLTPAQLQERSIISNSLVPRPEVNAFRDLRTRLQATADGHNFVTLVAAVSAGSGASYVCRNLAAAFAFHDTRSAMIVDCNPYHPSQHTTMHIEPVRGGLTDYLRDAETDLADIVYETGVPRLRLIPAGSPDEFGGEYFSSFRMHLLLDTLRNRYPARYLLLDGPPVSSGPDARILSDLADIVVLVAGYGRDNPAAIAQAAANFDPNKFAGVVFNQGV